MRDFPSFTSFHMKENKADDLHQVRNAATEKIEEQNMHLYFENQKYFHFWLRSTTEEYSADLLDNSSPAAAVCPGPQKDPFQDQMRHRTAEIRRPGGSAMAPCPVQYSHPRVF